jgi:hypothetical protein
LSTELSRSIHCLQALGADVQTLGDVTLGDGHFLDIGLPLAFGPFMGMADIVPKLRALATNITLGHFIIHPFRKSAATAAANLRF